MDVASELLEIIEGMLLIVDVGEEKVNARLKTSEYREDFQEFL